ncbi:phospholipase D-like domain-containing protein [Sphingosinicella microcystinivorans]|uniref:phospholipase D-like domain-containing protein n=1 Tax=Sphingosinicella microcystinivorans TaxID=335406 RepID=UPI0022F388CB|nr:phospholipase D-like domain-containing protein [Sphingosinicella microcystinivorans]WBX83308.1 phospholipase D-like domain-containing protein [Sphingosinicella microcystinivorans]
MINEEQGGDPSLAPVVEAGRNCWRIERAARAAAVVDAADYYHYVREAMLAARRRILIIGWDFDTRIALEPDGNGHGESLGHFFLRLARENPARQIDILKWSFGALKQFLRPRAAWMLLRWQMTRAIDFRFDSFHPAGCSHHQKIVVIDERFAVCGGIDISCARWDTTAHADDDPRRTLPDGKPYGPWHDVTMMLDGDAAQALADLGRDRWKHATRRDLPPAEDGHDHWPDDAEVDFRDVDIAVARTRAAWRDCAEVREIEALWLDMIAAARRFIYIENQYLTSGRIAAAIAARMEEDDPPEIVVVMPRSADGWLEQKAMDAARVLLARAIGKADRLNRFRIYVPVTGGGADIYVHAKVAIVDDRLLKIGSANLNNRSMGLDSECDVIIDAALPANADTPPAIAALRTRLLAEHLDVSPEDFAARFAETGSLVDTIEALRGQGEALRGPGKTLDLLDLEKPGPLDQFIAGNELLDPEDPDGFFEPLHKRGLRMRWREGMARLKGRIRRRPRRR